MLAESMKCFRFDKNVPRFTTAVLAAVNKSNQKNVTRTFFSSKSVERDKSVLYNSNELVVPSLDHTRIQPKDRRAIPIISPSEQFSASLSLALEKAYGEELERLSIYFPAGLKLDRYLKARNLPLEGVHLRRKEELIKNILSEEYDNEGEVDQQSFIAEQQRTDDYNKRKQQLEKE